MPAITVKAHDDGRIIQLGRVHGKPIAECPIDC